VVASGVNALDRETPHGWVGVDEQRHDRGQGALEQHREDDLRAMAVASEPHQRLQGPGAYQRRWRAEGVDKGCRRGAALGQALQRCTDSAPHRLGWIVEACNQGRDGGRCWHIA
jgi:hypothetical protein